jgi:hypothetical protein
MRAIYHPLLCHPPLLFVFEPRTQFCALRSFKLLHRCCYFIIILEDLHFPEMNEGLIELRRSTLVLHLLRLLSALNTSGVVALWKISRC